MAKKKKIDKIWRKAFKEALSSYLRNNKWNGIENYQAKGVADEAVKMYKQYKEKV